MWTEPHAKATDPTLSNAWVSLPPEPPERNKATAPKLATDATTTTKSIVLRPGFSRTACLAVASASIRAIVAHTHPMNTAAASIHPASNPTRQPPATVTVAPAASPTTAATISRTPAEGPLEARPDGRGTFPASGESGAGAAGIFRGYPRASRCAPDCSRAMDVER